MSCTPLLHECVLPSGATDQQILWLLNCIVAKNNSFLAEVLRWKCAVQTGTNGEDCPDVHYVNVPANCMLAYLGRLAINDLQHNVLHYLQTLKELNYAVH
jgi:hypothetical protein